MQRKRVRSVWVGGLLFAAAASCTASEPDADSAPVATPVTPSGGGRSGNPAGVGAAAGSGMRGGSGAPATGATPVGAGAPGGSAAAGTSAIAGNTGAASGGNAGSTSTGSAADSGAPGGSPPSGGAPSGGIGGAANGGRQPMLPAPAAECPTIATGMIMVMGQQVRIWVGPQTGPMVFYWHGTGSRAEEAIGGLGPGLNEVMSQGGVVASFTTTTQMGRTTANNVWYTTDFEMADQILACANQQGLIDPQRIYSAGCSAGGIHTSSMAYSRSGYLAASTPNSGGIVFPTELQDMSHVPFQMSSHGAREKDVVRAGQANAMRDVYFADITANNNEDLVSKGGFAINCDHGGEHCANPPDLTAAMWQFLKDHTFSTTTSPYASGLPASFPTYCQIIR